jgi:Permuted papain-like amidase enzyme, YaeF/YiiX, C92 family
MPMMLQAPAPAPMPPVLSVMASQQLARQVRVGDVVFIRVPQRPFLEVADATLTWTNHVGIVVTTNGREPVVAESTFPVSKLTPLTQFVDRSEAGRVAVMRLHEPLTALQQRGVYEAAEKRLGVLYDTGFDFRSSRQFCAKYVHEVLAEATGHPVGDVQSFEQLLQLNPDAKLGFWKLWFFGRIPWQRQTMSPVAIMNSPLLGEVFDGVAVRQASAVQQPSAPTAEPATH